MDSGWKKGCVCCYCCCCEVSERRKRSVPEDLDLWERQQRGFADGGATRKMCGGKCC